MSTSGQPPAPQPEPAFEAAPPPSPTVAAGPVGRLRRSLRWIVRKRILVGLAIVLLLGAVIWGSVFFILHHRQVQQEAEAAKQEAEAAKQEVEAAKRDARQLLAYSHLAAANNAWRDGDTRTALAALNRCPPETWGWEYHYLRRLFLASSFPLHGHRDEVNSVCFSPDGGQLASASRDSTVRVWDAATGLETRRFEAGKAKREPLFPGLAGQTSPRDDFSFSSVTCVCYSPDGRFLASTNEDGQVQLTSASGEGKAIVLGRHKYFARPSSRAWCVAFSPDGKRLATGGEDKVHLWDVPNRKELPSLAGHSGIHSVCFSPDGLRVAGGGADGTIQFWDTRTGQPTRSLVGHKERVNEVCFSPDGRRLASAGADRTVRLWDVVTGRLLSTLGGHNAAVLCVRFSPDGLRLASGGEDQLVRLWDARTGQQLAAFRGHVFGVSSVSFRPDGQFLASGGWDGTVRLWDCRKTEEGIALEGLAGKINYACFTPDRSKVIGACADKTVRIWEADTGRLLHTLKGHSNEVLRVCVSADGTRAASRAVGEIRVWHVKTGELEKNMTWDWDRELEWARPRLGLSFTPDGQGVMVAMAGEVGFGWVFVHDIQSGRIVAKRAEPGEPITSAALAPDGRSLAFGVGNRVVVEGIAGMVKEGQPGQGQKPLAVLESPYHAPMNLFFSRDERHLGASYGGGEVVYWDVEKKPESVEGRPLVGHVGGVNALDCSPDGRRLATAGADRTVRLWDTELGRQTLVLQGHRDSVLAISFSADGQRLTSVSADGILRKWDAGVNVPVSSWTAPFGLVCTLCFSPDEKFLARRPSEN